MHSLDNAVEELHLIMTLTDFNPWLYMTNRIGQLAEH